MGCCASKPEAPAPAGQAPAGSTTAVLHPSGGRAKAGAKPAAGSIPEEEEPDAAEHAPPQPQAAQEPPAADVGGTVDRFLRQRSARNHDPVRMVENQKAPQPENEPLRLQTVALLRARHFPTNDPQATVLTMLVCDVLKLPMTFIAIVEQESFFLKCTQRERDHILKHNNVFPRTMGMPQWVLAAEIKQMLVVDKRLDDIGFQDEVMKRCATGCCTPIIASNGQRIGALGAVSTERVPLSYEHCALFINISELIAREIERDALEAEDASVHSLPSAHASLAYKHVLADHTGEQGMQRSVASLAKGIILCDASKAGWPVVFVTTVMARLVRRDPAELIGKTLDELFEPTDDKAEWHEEQARLLRQRRRLATRSAKGRAPELDPDLWVTLAFHCATVANLEIEMGIPSYAEQPEMDGQVPDVCFYTVTVDLQTPAPPSQPETRSSSLESSNKSEIRDMIQPKDLFDEAILETLLGKGSFGSVFKAQWRGMEVALKVLEWPSASLEPAAADKEMQEAAMAIEFSHPGIVKTFAYAARLKKAKADNRIQIAEPAIKLDNDLVEVRGKGKAPGDRPKFMEAWIIMELCGHGCLQDANDRGWLFTKSADGKVEGPNLRAISTCALQIAEGMDYLHEKGCMHRDLTASNVLLASDKSFPWGFSCKIADFGMSRITEKKTDPTDTVTMGTVTHMPPELLMEGKLSPSADVYAFGVLLWSMLTGLRPWNRMSRVQVIVNICIQKKTLDVPAGLPKDLGALCKQCLATDMRSRPDFPEVVTILRRIVAELQ